MMMSSERIRCVAVTPYAAPIVHNPLGARREREVIGSAPRKIGKPTFRRAKATIGNSDEFFADIAVAHRHMAPL